MRHLKKEWLVLVSETQKMAILMPESVGTKIAYHKHRRLNKNNYEHTYVPMLLIMVEIWVMGDRMGECHQVLSVIRIT